MQVDGSGRGRSSVAQGMSRRQILAMAVACGVAPLPWLMAAEPIGIFSGLRNGSDRGESLQLLRRALIAELGEESYRVWFRTMDTETFKAGVLTLSVPVAFIRTFITLCWRDQLLSAARRVDPSVSQVDVALREPWSKQPRVLLFSDVIPAGA